MGPVKTTPTGTTRPPTSTPVTRSSVDAEPGDRARFEPDAAAHERIHLLGRGLADDVREVDDAVRPLPQQLSLLDAVG